MSVSTVFTLVTALFAIARALVTYAQQREWMDQGSAQTILKALQDSDDAIARAKAARDLVHAHNTRDPASVLRDDDGFRRAGD